MAAPTSMKRMLLPWEAPEAKRCRHEVPTDSPFNSSAEEGAPEAPLPPLDMDTIAAVLGASSPEDPPPVTPQDSAAAAAALCPLLAPEQLQQDPGSIASWNIAAMINGSQSLLHRQASCGNTLVGLPSATSATTAAAAALAAGPAAETVAAATAAVGAMGSYDDTLALATAAIAAHDAAEAAAAAALAAPWAHPEEATSPTAQHMPTGVPSPPVAAAAAVAAAAPALVCPALLAVPSYEGDSEGAAALDTPTISTAAAAHVVSSVARLQKQLQKLHIQYQSESRALMRCCKVAYAACKGGVLALPAPVQVRIKSVLQDCNEQHAAVLHCWEQLMTQEAAEVTANISSAGPEQQPDGQQQQCASVHKGAGASSSPRPAAGGAGAAAAAAGAGLLGLAALHAQQLLANPLGAVRQLLRVYQQCLQLLRRMYDCHDWELTAVKHVFRTLLHTLCEQQEQGSSPPPPSAAAAAGDAAAAVSVQRTCSPLGAGMLQPSRLQPKAAAPATAPSAMRAPLPHVHAAHAAAAAAAVGTGNGKAQDARALRCLAVLQQQPDLMLAVRQVQLQGKLGRAAWEAVLLTAHGITQQLAAAAAAASPR